MFRPMRCRRRFSAAALVRVLHHDPHLPGADGDPMADLNPASLEILTGAMVEPGLAGGNSADAVQFERQGYFCRDPDSAPGRLVFNRTIGLRDSWTKTQPSSR